jgi:hypothetical protein
LVGLITLTLTLRPIDTASFNNCIIPIRSSRRNELTVGNKNNTSCLGFKMGYTDISSANESITQYL